MKSYRPQGNRLLVLPLETEEKTTEEGKILLVDHVLSEVKVVEVSTELSDIYKKGDILIVPQKTGISQWHNGKTHLWINGGGHPAGDVFAIVTKEK